MKKKLSGWKELEEGVMLRESHAFDHAVIALPQDVVHDALNNVQTPTFLVTTIFCSICRGYVDCTGYCTECENLTWQAEQDLIKSGAPLPVRKRDRVCKCKWLADYCLCHVNLVVFSPRKRK
jgi:hypothetical protein